MTTKVNIPKKIKAYEVEDLVGHGGMGQVFRASHELLERPIALKRFSPSREDMDTDENRERFLREGKALARLNHQGIVGVHDIFDYRGQMYIVLEFVDGFTLERLLEKGPLPLDVACIILLAVTEALEHAHFHHIVHRDIKPSNIMVGRDGQVKLMDFGIARDDNLDKVTKTGNMVGTPMYLAPEVVRGKEATEASDVYALGAVMYYALSGRKLFAHATKDSLFPMIAAGKYPPLQRVSDRLPRRLRALVHRCLAKNPNKRFDSVSELRQELELFLASRHVWANHAERLVGYLKAKGMLTKEEAQTWVDVSVAGLCETGTFESRVPYAASRTWVLMAVVGLFGLVTGWAAYSGWLENVLSVIRQL